MRLALRIFAAVLVLLLLLTLALFGILQTEAGGRAAARAVSKIASTPGATELQIERIAPGLPGRIGVFGLRLADANGEWLAADHVEVRWRPLALLRGGLSVAEASADGVRLSRLPGGGAKAEADGDFALPSLPLDLQVDRFRFDDVEVGAAVAGETVALRAHGAVAAKRGSVFRTDADIVRTNGVGGAIRLAAQHEPAGERFLLDLHAEEPEGGIVGKALGLDGRPPVRLVFAGDGPLSAWRGRLDAGVGKEIRLAADLASEKTAEGTRLNVAGDAHVAALLPEAARALGEDGIGFTLALRRPGADVLAIDGAEVSAGGVGLAAEGRLLLHDRRFDGVGATLSVADGAALAPLLAPASLDAAEVRLDLSGPWAKPGVTLAAGVLGLRAAGISIAGTAVQAGLGAADSGWMRVDADAVLAGVTVGGTDVDALLGAPPRLRLRAGFDPQGQDVAVERVELLSPALTAAGRGATRMGEGVASLRALVPDLGALSGAAGVELAGAAALAVDARLEGSGVTAGLGLASSGFRSALPSADALLGEAPSLRAALRLDPETGVASLEHVLIVGDGLRGTARASVRDGVVGGEYDMEVPDVAPAAAAAGVAATGALALAGSLAGPVADPEAEAVLTLSGGAIADVVASPVRVELRAKSLASAPGGLLTASASAAGEPLRLAVPFARDDRGGLRLGPIEGSGAGVGLSGSLNQPQAGGAVLGRLALTAGAGGRPVALAGHRLDGEATLSIALDERNGEQTVQIAGTGRSLALVTPNGPVAAAESLSLRADIVAAGAPRGEVVLSAVRPTIAGASPAAIDARVTGSTAEARYEVTVRGDDPAEVLRGEGTFAEDDGGSRLSVASLAGRFGGLPIDLRRPLVISQDGSAITVGDLDLSAGGGSIGAAGRMGPAGTDGRLVLRDLPLTLVRAIAPGVNLTGMLNGEGSVRTEGAELAGRFAVRLSDVRAGSMAQAPPLQATAAASVGSGTAALELRVASLGGSPLLLDASVPARVDARTLAADIGEQAPLRGRLVWSGAVARLWELTPFTEQRLTGDANVNLTLGGTLAAPEVGGEAALVNGRYEHFLTETVIDGLSLEARPTGAGGIVLALRATDGGKGRIRGDGRVTLAKKMAPLVDLALTFDEATLVRRDDVSATLSGRVAFRQDQGGAFLSGELTSNRMEIRLIDRLPPSVVVLDVTEINLPPGHLPTRTPTPPEAAAAGPAVSLDVSVKLPRRVFVRGRGLESEWQGDLRVSGTSADPRLVGVVAVRSGTFDFAGKRFTLETGEVGFTGGATPNPTLNVQAVRTTPDLTAIIRVTGTALDPEIQLASTPALPESEILSRVLFEKGVAKLGPVEAAQLAMALDTLASGESMSEDALSYVRNLLGLDVLTIETGEQAGEGPALGVGRYVAEGVYVGARQGVAEDSTAGTVEIEVLPGLAIESEVGEGADGATGALGLRWKWDY